MWHHPHTLDFLLLGEISHDGIDVWLMLPMLGSRRDHYLKTLVRS